MPEAWRIVKTRYVSTAFSGEGARLFGGRWTRKGRRAVYTSATISLATLEILVHLENPAPLPAWSLIPVTFPEELVEILDQTTLPADWQASPAPTSLQLLGDAWLDAGAKPAWMVPSAIVPGEFNYILNPEHPDFAGFTIGTPRPYDLDPRLVS